MLSGTVLAAGRAGPRRRRVSTRRRGARRLWRSQRSKRRRIDLAARLSAFDAERMLEQGYCAYLFAQRRADALRAPADESPISTASSIPFSMAKRVSGSPIVHLPFPLGDAARLRRGRRGGRPGERQSRVVAAARAGGIRHAPPRRGFSGSAGRPLDRTERVTIIIPTRNRRGLLERCLDSITPAADDATARSSSWTMTRRTRTLWSFYAAENAA